MKIKDLRNRWLKYSWQWRPSAFWFWNEDMDEERMETMLSGMERDGIRECLFHPVHGLTMEYLSEDFFEKYRKGLALAKKHGLKVWIYDEYSWPTGCVAGFLLRDHPEYKGWYLAYTDGVAEPKRSNRVHDGTTGAPWTWEQTGYIDTLNPDAMKCFLEMNYQKLKEGCGEYWDDVILGFFTDEPATMMPYDEGNFWNAPALPWTEELPRVFRELNGYDIEPHYNDLFLTEKNKYKEDYFKAVKYLHVNAYHKQIGDWCKANNKFYTGHLGEDSVHQQVRYGGSLYQCLSNMTHPGVDFLNFCDPDWKYDQEMVASVAKHSSDPCNPKPVYMEAYGISTYSLTLAEMYYKWQALALQRVNDIALMGMQQSTSSVRKRTYWPPFTEDEPWWDYYPVFRDAAARCQGISNLGKDIRKYAIMYPQYETEQYSTTVVVGDDPINIRVNALIDLVCSSQNQYDWIFPEILSQAKVQNGKVVFPNETYDAILATDEFEYFVSTQKELERLEKEGAKILRDLNLSSFFKKEDKKGPEQGLLSAPIAGGGENFSANSNILDAPFWADTVNISLDRKSRVYTYEYEDGFMIAVRNVSENSAEAVIECKDNNKNMSEWDPLTGSVYSTNLIKRTMKPHSTIYISVTQDSLVSDAYPVIKSKNLDINLNIKPVKYNMAPFSSVKALHPEKGWIDITKVPAKDTSLGRFFAVKDSTILNSHPCPTLSDDFYKCENIKFSCDFTVRDKTKIGILGEGKYLKNVKINGISLPEPAKKEFIWDWTNVFYDFTDYIKIGENTAEFTLAFESWETSIRNEAFFAHYPMPSVDVCLAGDFIYKDGAVSTLPESKKSLPVNLSDEGFAYTYGKASLTGEFTKTDEMENLSLELVGDCACEIKIDGKTIGEAITEYIFSIKDIENGKHEIEIILTGVSASLMDAVKCNLWELVKIRY
ncbi:MAG: hypothetical protein KBT47_02995 [Armatimonadetes bacterium]|nr:hypothetical protein [Candidatus Hippobium faecium]